MYRIYNPATRKVVGGRNVVFVEPPSQRVPRLGGYYYQCEGPVRGRDTIMTDDSLLRDVCDLSQCLNFSAS